MGGVQVPETGRMTPFTNEGSRASRLGLLLPERSGAPTAMPPVSAETIAQEGGGQFMGWQESLPGKPRVALFRDPKTGTTLGLRENEMSPAAVAKKISDSRGLYKIGPLESK